MTAQLQPLGIYDNIAAVNGSFMTWDQIAQAGNLNFKPVKVPIMHPDYHTTSEQMLDALRNKDMQGFQSRLTELNHYDHIPGGYAILRDDTRTPLGVVGNRYEPLAHGDGFKMIDNIIGEVDGGSFVSAGGIDGGARVWGLADLKQSTHITGTDDKTDHYLLFSTSHDGSTSWEIRGTSNRIWCGNALHFELSRGAQSSFKVRHTRNGPEKIQAAQLILSSFRDSVIEYGELMNHLARRSMGKTEEERARNTMPFLYAMFKISAEMQAKPSEIPTKTKQKMDMVLRNMHDCDEGKARDTENTAYNLFHSYTRYVDNQRTASISTSARASGVTTVEQARARSSIFGSFGQSKQSALAHIRTLADDLPEHVIPQRTIVDMAPTGEAVSVIELVEEEAKTADDFLTSLFDKVDFGDDNEPND